MASENGEFFKGGTHQPFWKLEYITEHDKVLDTSKILDNYITSINITSELGKAGTASVTFEHGATPKPAPWLGVGILSPSPTRRFVRIRAGYRNLDEGERNIAVVELTHKRKIGTSRLAASSGELSYVPIDPSSVLFFGVANRPNIVGSNAGLITFVSSMVGHEEYNGNAFGVYQASVNKFVRVQGFKVNGKTQSLNAQLKLFQTADIEAKNLIIKSFFNDFYTKVIKRLPGGQADRLKFDTDAIPSDYLQNRDEGEAIAWSATQYVQYLSVRQQWPRFLRTYADKLGVGYDIIPAPSDAKPEDAGVTYQFYPTIGKSAKRTKIKSPGYEVQADNVIPILRYGIEVMTFRFQSSNIPVIAASGGKISITALDKDGVLTTWSVDEGAAKEFLKSQRNIGRAGVDNVVKTLTDLARTDFNRFIDIFIKFARSKHKPIQKSQPTIGKSGFTLTLNLKWAIPGFRTGILIYFTGDVSSSSGPSGAIKSQNLLPTYITGVYRIVKIVTKLDARQDIFTQTLTCKL